MVMLGTKWPSMTSTWTQSAPAASMARTSSPRRAKSDARMDGAMMTGLAMPSLSAMRALLPVAGRGQGLQDPGLCKMTAAQARLVGLQPVAAQLAHGPGHLAVAL